MSTLKPSRSPGSVCQLRVTFAKFISYLPQYQRGAGIADNARTIEELIEMTSD
jgi:hypothetical protein